MSGESFEDRLRRELARRRQANPRYSLRAYAVFLGADHSTLSQVLRGKRRIPLGQLRRWGKRLGMAAEEIAAYVAAQHVPDAAVVKRQEQLRHWTAEALALVNDPTHWQIVHRVQSPGFQPDCRWLARESGVSVDQVNVALSRLLRLRLLEIQPPRGWKILLGRRPVSEVDFRKHALIRVREFAAEEGVELRRTFRQSAIERNTK